MVEFEETWKSWFRRFWWLRGVTAALALTALAPTFIDLSRYEFLRAFHAVIVGWNLVTEKLGEIIGEIPFQRITQRNVRCWHNRDIQPRAFLRPNTAG